MAPLTLDLFASAAYDVERAQYGVLGALQHVQRAFAQNAVYPHLGKLIALYESLRSLMERSKDLQRALPARARAIDLKAQKVVYEWPELDGEEMARVKELIQWALPRIRDAIEEGRTIYEFVEERLRMETVGLVPSYVQEGYLLVHDREAEALHVVRYHLSAITDAEEQYRSLRTAHVETLRAAPLARPSSPRAVKLRLVRERRDLPNPATYFFDSEVAFPFEPTVYPIVKRKLMRHLATEMGDA